MCCVCVATARRGSPSQEEGASSKPWILPANTPSGSKSNYNIGHSTRSFPCHGKWAHESFSGVNRYCSSPQIPFRGECALLPKSCGLKRESQTSDQELKHTSG